VEWRRISRRAGCRHASAATARRPASGASRHRPRESRPGSALPHRRPDRVGGDQGLPASRLTRFTIRDEPEGAAAGPSLHARTSGALGPASSSRRSSSRSCREHRERRDLHQLGGQPAARKRGDRLGQSPYRRRDHEPPRSSASTITASSANTERAAPADGSARAGRRKAHWTTAPFSRSVEQLEISGRRRQPRQDEEAVLAPGRTRAPTTPSRLRQGRPGPTPGRGAGQPPLMSAGPSPPRQQRAAPRLARSWRLAPYAAVPRERPGSPRQAHRLHGVYHAPGSGVQSRADCLVCRPIDRLTAGLYDLRPSAYCRSRHGGPAPSRSILIRLS